MQDGLIADMAQEARESSAASEGKSNEAHEETFHGVDHFFDPVH